LMLRVRTRRFCGCEGWNQAASRRFLGVCVSGQHPEKADPTALTAELKSAREALVNAAANVDIMLRLVKQAEDLFPH
jgi:hypothetical protein